MSKANVAPLEVFTSASALSSVIDTGEPIEILMPEKAAIDGIMTEEQLSGVFTPGTMKAFTSSIKADEIASTRTQAVSDMLVQRGILPEHVRKAPGDAGKTVVLLSRVDDGETVTEAARISLDAQWLYLKGLAKYAMPAKYRNACKVPKNARSKAQAETKRKGDQQLSAKLRSIADLMDGKLLENARDAERKAAEAEGREYVDPAPKKPTKTPEEKIEAMVKSIVKVCEGTEKPKFDPAFVAKLAKLIDAAVNGKVSKSDAVAIRKLCK